VRTNPVREHFWDHDVHQNMYHIICVVGRKEADFIGNKRNNSLIHSYTDTQLHVDYYGLQS